MKKIVSIFFTFLILLTTLHLAVATHYCGGRVAEVKLSILGDASCGMDDNNGECASTGSYCSNSESISKKPCCENELTQISITDNYKPASNSELTNLQSLIVAFHSNLTFTHEQGYVTPVKSYKPPDYNSVSLPFIQVFLV